MPLLRQLFILTAKQNESFNSLKIGVPRRTEFSHRNWFYEVESSGR